MGGALRKVFLEPALEQPGHLMRQAQQHVAGRTRTGFAGGFQQALQLHVVDHRDHRRAHHADRHAGLVQRTQYPQARRRRGCARLHDAFEFVVQGREADRHADQPLLGQRHQQVQVAQHQRPLGDDVHRMPEAQQDLQCLARQPLLALQRLIGVGVHPQGDGLRHVARLAQLGLQPFGEVGLGDQPGLEIDARRKIPVRVRWPRKTVDADVLC